MTSDQTEFDQQHDQTPPTQFVPDVPDLIAELPFPKTVFPILSVRELDPLEIGDQEEDSDRDGGLSESFEVRNSAEYTEMPYRAPETPEGYKAPQFDSLHAVDDFAGDELDALFAALSKSASGQSADIAVWCPWISGTSNS